MRFNRQKCFLLSIFILTSCDPDFSVEYVIENKTENDVSLSVYQLLDPTKGPNSYDTIIAGSESLLIYSFSSLGVYSNPTDTITIFDSLIVSKDNVASLKRFKQFNDWKYSVNETNHRYELEITEDDF
jgi:hypothetical protein